MMGAPRSYIKCRTRPACSFRSRTSSTIIQHFAIHSGLYYNRFTMYPRVWLITGTSSGFGSELVKEVISRGDKVIATARNLERISHMKDIGAATLQLDVTASQEVLNRKAEEAISIYGNIDIVVNNAGYTQFGIFEENR